MPRTATKPKKKDQGPLIVHTKSEPFYKAFLFPEKNPDMIVDTSGDTFSDTPENAIRALFRDMSTEIKNKIPDCMFMFEDEELDTENLEKSPYAKNLVLLHLTANWAEELEAAKTVVGDDDLDYIVRIKDLHEGYTTSLQDYSIEFIQLKSNTKTPPYDWQLIKLKLVVPDPDRRSPLLPERIDIGCKSNDSSGVSVTKF